MNANDYPLMLLLAMVVCSGYCLFRGYVCAQKRKRLEGGE